MKTTMSRFGCILAALTVTALAQEPAPEPKISADNPAAQKPSPAVSEQITAGLPKYTPAPPQKPQEPVMAPNPDVLELPKMTVKQKPRPRLTPDLVSSKKDIGADWAKHNFTGLDQALNKFTLPLFGTSIEARAYEEYLRARQEQVNSEVSNISKALEVVDPKEAKALRDAATK